MEMDPSSPWEGPPRWGQVSGETVVYGHWASFSPLWMGRPRPRGRECHTVAKSMLSLLHSPVLSPCPPVALSGASPLSIHYRFQSCGVLS